MLTKRTLTIVLGLILVVLLACECEEDPRHFSPAPNINVEAGPTETLQAGILEPSLTPTSPPSNWYYTSSNGSYTISVWTAFFAGTKQTYTCTGQNASIQMIILPGTGEVSLSASLPNIDIYGDCSLVNGGGQSPFVKQFSGTLQDDNSVSYVKWDACDPANSGRAYGTAVASTLINLVYPHFLNDDDIFRGGAYCETGDDAEGSKWSLDFTVYYRGDYQP